MTTMQTNVESRVISVIAHCAGLSSGQLAPSHWQEPLTGHTFNLFSVDLIYILFEIEQEFGIRISPDSLAQYGFSSISGICSVVQETLERT